MKFFTAILSLLLVWGAPVAAADYSEVALSGSVAQGGLVYGTVAPGTKVLLDGKVVKVGRNGEFVFGFGRDAASTASLVIMRQAVLVRRGLSQLMTFFGNKVLLGQQKGVSRAFMVVSVF